MNSQSRGHDTLSAEPGQGGTGIVCNSRDLCLCCDISQKVLPGNVTPCPDVGMRARRNVQLLTWILYSNLTGVCESASHGSISFPIAEGAAGALLENEVNISAVQYLMAGGIPE